jgi:hypothetical protein
MTASVPTSQTGVQLAAAYNAMVERGAQRAAVKLPIPWADVHVHYSGKVTVIDSGVRVVALEVAMERALRSEETV